MRALAALLLLVALLAGCSGKAPPKESTADPLKQADFTDLDLAATATKGVIRGIVVDDSIRPIVGANISLTPGGLNAKSTAEGTFGFDDLEPGTYFIHVSKVGYTATQSSADVVAGVDDPPVIKMLLVATPDSRPYFVVDKQEGFMTCGVAVVASSVGCDTSTADTFGDRVYFLENFTILPTWTQGELVWEQTQVAGGGFIWQIARPGTNDYYSGGETGGSPLLASIDTATLEKNKDNILKEGVEYRVFGGPNENCAVPGTYGCGLTLDQKFTAYMHSFFNFMPPEGWRFTVDGDPVPPS